MMTGIRQYPKFYLAAPFFNEPQLALVKMIEGVFLDANIPLFSPRLLDNNGGKPDDAEWTRRFKNNVDNLHDADHVLAVADFELPQGDGLFLVGQARSSGYTKDYASQAMGGPLNTAEIKGKHKAGPLSLPDTGTVFEMGMQYGMFFAALKAFPDFVDRDRHMQRKIVLYTERRPEETLNVMLTKCCEGVLRGEEDLRKFLNGGNINWTVSGPWKGKVR